MRCPGSEEATVIVISGSGFHPLAGAGAAAPFAGPDALARLQIEPVCEAAADLWPEIGRDFIDCPTHEGLSDLLGATTLSLSTSPADTRVGQECGSTCRSRW